MSRVDQSRWKKPCSTGCPRIPLLSALALLALTGCEGDGLKQGDPYLGIHGTPAPATSAAAGGQPAQTAAGSVPPLPATHALTSPAALAGGTTPTPVDPRDLRIGTPPVVPASLPSGAAARGVAPGSAVLDAPQPVAESTSQRLAPVAAVGGASPPAATAPAAPPAGTLTFEQAQQILKQRGVTFQRLETWGDQGQWKFRCSLPIPGSTNMNRTYETDTPLPTDPLTAVRAVLDKIEKDQPR